MRHDLQVIHTALRLYKEEAAETEKAVPNMTDAELRSTVAALVKVQALSISLLFQFIEETHAVICAR